MVDVVLRSGRDRSVRRRHPWVLSGAVARVDGPAEPGADARVLSAEGEVLGFGHLSPASTLRVRLLTFGKDAIGEGLLRERVARAVERRLGSPLVSDTDAVRLVNAEADGLPGLVADRYGDVVVARLTSAGMIARREEVAHALREGTGAAVGFERADAAAARREGVATRQGPLWGEPPTGPVWIHEGARRYAVDIAGGQKTGFYLDQRETRDLVETLAPGRRVVDLFAYTGGFSVAALHGAAESVTLVESSAEALALARRNLEAAQASLEAAPPEPGAGPSPSFRAVQGDAFRFLRGTAEPFDLCVIDPPPLARARRDVPRAARAYKDLLLFALRRAAPGAFVLAFACSHHVGPDLFRKIAFGASLDAGRPVQVVRVLGAAADHPVSLDHPEGAYLTGLLLQT